PTAPIIDNPTVDGLVLVQALREFARKKSTIGISTGVAVRPVAIMKHAPTADEFRTTLAFSEGHRLYNAVEAMFDNWPDRWKAHEGKYLWLNSVGDVISPIWEGRSNVIGEPAFAVLATLAMWQDLNPEFMRGFVWLNEAQPYQFNTRHFPLFLLSLLPDQEFLYVLKNFEVLGQGFMRYFLQWSGGQGQGFAGMRDLNQLLVRFSKNIGVYGTNAVIKALAKSALT
ncbi:MAG TPA: hypothetical protein VIY48_21595, partial [Candidatus Paceibacterota bacterium]